MKQRNKWILIGIVAVVIGLGMWWYTSSKSNSINSFQACVDAGYPVRDSYPQQCATPDGRNFTQPVSGTETTIEGTVVCLPHLDTDDPQTLECAFGLKTGENTYYALRTQTSTSELSSSAGSDRTVRVTGSIKYEPSDTYKSSGTLTVDSFEFTE